MSGVLLLSNGHGEVAIASRIAQELHAQRCDHLALVGDIGHAPALHDVGPRRAMPSGGLIAMGNVRNIARDVAGGLLAHTLAQLRFIRSVRGRYDVAVAVGDVFALVMALQARAQSTVFVGTAKSVHHAPYGPMERRLIARSNAVFVRDSATAEDLRKHGIAAQAANVIVDLYAAQTQPRIEAPFDPCIAIFPGSREAAYADARSLCRIVREIAKRKARMGAVLSVAPALEPTRMQDELARDGWRVRARNDEREPFSLYDGEREIVRAWRGPLGVMIAQAQAVLGQAGTANEAAAAAGLPVIAYERSESGKRTWYRARQAGLLGGALLIVGGEPAQAALAVEELLADPARREAMGRIGRERMGPPGGAKRIAEAIQSLTVRPETHRA